MLSLQSDGEEGALVGDVVVVVSHCLMSPSAGPSLALGVHLFCWTSLNGPNSQSGFCAVCVAIPS